jgi:hypothetical protein
MELEPVLPILTTRARASVLAVPSRITPETPNVVGAPICVDVVLLKRVDVVAHAFGARAFQVDSLHPLQRAHNLHV